MLSIALSVLTGWAFDIYFLKSLSFSSVSMKPNSAICFLICGFLLTGVLKKQKTIECLLSLLVSALGIITLLEYIFKIDSGIDQLIFKDDLNAIGTSSPGKMSPVTAFNFLLIGFSFFDIEKKIKLRQSLMGVVLIISLFSLYGHLLNLPEFRNSADVSYTIVSIPGAISFILLVFGYFFKSPDKGFSNLFFSHSAGAVIFKRLAVPIFIILPALFYLRLLGEEAGWYDTSYGITLMVTTSVSLLFLLLLFTAGKLNEMEKDLIKYQMDLRTIFENTIAGFLLIDNDFRIHEFNNMFQHFAIMAWGKTVKKNDNIVNYIPEARKENFLNSYKKILQGEQVNYEVPYPKPDGNHIVFSLNYNPVINSEGNTIGCCVRCEGITERKKIEEKIIRSETQIRNFAAHLNHVLEEERAHLAREIHDELGQQIAGIKMGLSILKKGKGIDTEEEEKINIMITDADNTLQTMRKIATELRPGILDALGLTSSIQWLGNEFERKTKIKTIVKTNIPEKKFEKKIFTYFFRICQESLTNISKHAGAS